MSAGRFFITLGLIGAISACRSDDSISPGPPVIPTGVTCELRCIGSLSGDKCYVHKCTGTNSYSAASRIEIRWRCTEAGCGMAWGEYDEVVGRTTSFTLTTGGLVLMYTDLAGEPFQLIHQRADCLCPAPEPIPRFHPRAAVGTSADTNA